MRLTHPHVLSVPSIADRVAAKAHWIRTAGSLADPAVKLDADTFGDVLLSFRRLERAGIQIDAGLRGLMECLARQLRNTDADSDMDLEEEDHVTSDGLPGTWDDAEEEEPPEAHEPWEDDDGV